MSAGKIRSRHTAAPRVAEAPAQVPEALTDAVGYALRRAQIAVFADFTAALTEVDLRPAPYGVLLVIDANPGLSQREVCELLGFKQANLVAMINDLVARGLTERRRSPRDQRSHALHLTSKGREQLQRARSLQKKHEERMTRRLGTQQRQQLLSLLGQLFTSSGSD
jgi:DNA-binding MarR family transcriptional regulator